MERELISRYETSIDAILTNLEAATIKDALELAALPEQIRGYGPVKHQHVETALKRWNELDNVFQKVA